MGKLEQTISKLSAYVGDNKEERLLEEKLDQFTVTFAKIHRQFPKTTKKKCSVTNLGIQKFLQIENRMLRLAIDKQRNVIDVEKREGDDVTKLDEIKIQDNELYCVERGERFTEDILNDYICEVFAEILV
ncbi:hypothetical protein COF42_30045 [Bacillus wiedmannii]|uniref:DUF3942 family protein n=1 Tax=Bacillus wiedmannii TaxID=1890302 RepID=UPI000BFC1EAF|nr:DUF3942 family protein [Bacillus wiedmannii]PHC80410.1 hypothetical protein COF42_30045 [Bacillus wiedmannii]